MPRHFICTTTISVFCITCKIVSSAPLVPKNQSLLPVSVGWQCTSLSKILKMELPAVKKQQNRLPAKAAEKDKEEDFFENKKSRHNQLSKPLQEE